MSKSRWTKLLALLMIFGLIASACSSDDESDSSSGDSSDVSTDETTGDGSTDETTGDGGESMSFDGETVTITGPERDDPSIASINDTLNAWGETVGLVIEYTGDADWEANINTQVEGGNPPDISFFPQPGKLADFARAGSIVPLSDAADAVVDEFWADGFQQYGNVDGVQYGIPAKTDLKSLVWYQPAKFDDAGYTVPETFDEFTALIDTMAADDGPKPLCVGIESGQATGWPYTDWVEDMVLRLARRRRLRPVGRPTRSRSTIPQIAGGDADPGRPVDRGRTSSPPVVRSPRPTSQTTASRSSTGSATCTARRTSSPACSPRARRSPIRPTRTAVDVFYFPDINGDKPVLTAGIYRRGLQ